MENTEKHTCGMGGCGGTCGCGHHHMHILKWILKIAVLVIIFSFAFRMGELRGMLESHGYGNFGHGGMMYYGYGNDAGFDTGVAPATISTPATK